MRAVARIVMVGLAVLMAGPVGSDAAANRSARPVLLHLHWRLVARGGVQYALVSDRYVAFVTGSADRLAATLFDERTRTRKALSPPNCSILNNRDNMNFPLFFAAPWLLVNCGQQPPTYEQETYELYNLITGQWTQFSISAQCQEVEPSWEPPPSCNVVAIGRDWVKILERGANEHAPYDYYLQNISTGQFERDPVTSNGGVFDDLAAPSGSKPLCSPLRFPPLPASYGPPPPMPYIAPMSFYGQFAVTFEQTTDSTGSTTAAYRLRRCGSTLDAIIRFYPYKNYINGGPTPSADNQPVANSRAVLMTIDGVTLRGWFLPTLRRFRIRPGLGGSVAPVGLTNRTLYIRDGGQLWAATLPRPLAP